MDTPSWVKHFDGNSKFGEHSGRRASIDDEPLSCSRLSEFSDAKIKSIHHSQSYNGEYDNNEKRHSTGQILPRIHSLQSDICTLSEEEKRLKKRRRRRAADETSGYSTTSLSEVSEIDTPKQKGHRYAEQYGSPNRKRDSDERSERSRTSRVSQATSRHESEVSKTNNRRISESSRTPMNRRDNSDRNNLVRNSRVRSTTDSVASGHSGRSSNVNPRRTSVSSNKHDVQSLRMDRKISATDVVDPFAFIQPVPESFSTKVKKTMKPILGMLLMLILAASLGAAIYFAVELKKTQEDEIEMLRANLALKITGSRFGMNLDELSPNDFSSIALTYCQQMDDFYGKSKFESSYRGCEVLSIKNEHINFTLFFVEKEASKRDIISVIETSAPKANDSDQNVAIVDKFEIELKTVKIKIEHERTPVGFSKIKEKPKTEEAETTTIKTTTKMTTKISTTEIKKLTTVKSVQSTTKELETTTVRQSSSTVTDTPVSGTTDLRYDLTTTEIVITEDMLLAWEPCSKKNGSFFPHPLECNQYFQCSHKTSILQTCTGDLVFDISSSNCVKDRPGIECPDPKDAPPKPPATVAPKSDKSTKPTTTRSSLPSLSNRTRPLYPGRPEYDPKPCLRAEAGTLHAHPEDCAKFIQCIGRGEGQELTCATNLVYDPDAKTCIFPKNGLICPDILPCLQKNTGYFQHPFDCTLYIQCESGREKIQKCAQGLVWEPKVNSCMYRNKNSTCKETSA